MPQIQRKAKLLADIGCGLPERAEGLVVFLLVALDRHIDAGVAQVIRDSNFRNSYHCQSRIFEFVTNNLRNFFAQGFGDALGTMHKQAEVRRQESEFRSNLVLECPADSCLLSSVLIVPWLRSFRLCTLRSDRRPSRH